MELLIIFFYLLGIFIGGYVGYSTGKACSEDYMRKLRSLLQHKADELEVRLQDMDFEGEKQWGVALGENNVVYELLEYIDGEKYKDE